jgi:FixJ family two-component response regulator
MALIRTRIAVVDDDASVRRALGRLLRAAESDTESYGSGSEFLQSFHEFQPQCVVLDLHMEDMNGLDVQRHLTRIGQGVPVIVITGHDNPQAQADCLALGARAYLPKPVNGSSLIATIECLVSRSDDKSSQ